MMKQTRAGTEREKNGEEGQDLPTGTEWVRTRGKVRDGFQILLSAGAELCLPLSFPAIRDFYLRLSESVMTYAVDEYGEKLRREVAARNDPREIARAGTRQFWFRSRVVYEDRELLAFLCERTLRGSGTARGESRFLSHVWLKKEERLLPPSQILRAFGMKIRRERLPFRPDGIYPEGGELVFFRNAGEDAEFLEKRIEFRDADFVARKNCYQSENFENDIEIL